jgi:DNA polymerase III subunit chi
MTEITFHVNAADKLDYACRLLRTSQKRAAKVLVCASPEVLKQLSIQLWAMTPTEFLPHCFADAAPAVVALSPVVLVSDLSDSRLEHDVLLHLGAGLPVGFERFARLIEVVSQADADVQPARQRWTHYKKRGYALTRYDAVSKETSAH